MMVNTLRDEMVKRWAIPNTSVAYIYANTTPDSKLRAFVLWAIASIAGPGVLTEASRKSWPGDASFDILRLAWERKENKSANGTKDELTKMDMCQWHQHGKDEKCPAQPK